MEIQFRLNLLLKENDLTGSKLAKILDVSKSVVYFWLNGTTSPTAYYIVKICKYFGCSADYLLGLSDY